MEERRLMYRDGLEKQFVRKRTNGDEFDSRLVEYLVLHRFPSIHSRDDLIRLVMVKLKSDL